MTLAEFTLRTFGVDQVIHCGLHSDLAHELFFSHRKHTMGLKKLSEEAHYQEHHVQEKQDCGRMACMVWLSPSN